MLPSRGLRPAQFAPLSSRQSATLRSNTSRKFSSLPRTAGLSAPSCRASPLQSARWRTGAASHSHIVLTASSVRNGSWYAPWSWGKSSTPTGDAPLAGADQVPIAEFVSNPASHHIEPAVTSTTPELAPAGIGKAPIVNTASDATSTAADSTAAFNDSAAMDLLLSLEPQKDVIPKADFDPTALIDHAGQLKELGLDYGWGLTTVFERTIEHIYLNSGLGWAGAIMVASVAVRCVTFVFQVLSSDKMAGLAALKPLTQPIQEKLDAAIARGDKQAEQTYKIQQAQIMRPHMGGVFSMGGFMIVQAWIGISAFRCLRAMGELPVPGMMHDGFLWFKDLTVADPYYLLPAAITGIFYAIFKMGGETGVSTDAAGQSAMRGKMMTGFAFFMGFVTCWQAAGLQLYFLVSGILGAGTGFLLRQNWFRRALRIRQLPTPESTEIYSKVVRGEVKLADIKGRDGKVHYQAPRTLTNRRTATTLSGIKMREGTALPAHVKIEKPVVEGRSERPDRDEDYEEGAKGTMMERLDYYRRNYRLAYMYRRMQASMDRSMTKMGYGQKGTEAQRKRRSRAEQYEIERKRRFENRS